MTKCFALVLICIATVAGSHSQQPSQDIITSNCTLAGTWTQNSEGLGPSMWTITENGDATESGLGNAKGKATLSGRTLRIDWTIPGYNNSGYYQWTLGDNCSGPGVAVNTVSGAKRNTTVSRNPDVAAIHAELRDIPTEVWVGWGRPSMSTTLFITGFRRNTQDPVVFECPDAINLAGDHPFKGDSLKTIQIFACGSTAQTYDWPAKGYGWGVLISAPATDTVGNTQPGRRQDECIGTNPVRLRVSQKGAGSTTVTIAPEIVLKARGIGGGGTYAPSECRGRSSQTQIPTGGIAIITANGQNALTAVGGGGVQGPGALHTDATVVSEWETFVLERQSDGTYAIRTSKGTYLTAMRGGGQTGEDVLHTDARRIDAWEKFTLEPQSDGTFAIKTASGNYLTVVNGGGVGSGRGAIHTNATSVGAWEKFKLVPIPGGGTSNVNYDTGGRGNSTNVSTTGVGTASGSVFEQDTDRKGQDYQPLELPQPEPKICSDACAEDPNCKAWTYVKPNVYGPKAYCYLKSGVPQATPNSCCVSGVKAGGSASGGKNGNPAAGTAGNDGFTESLNNITLKGDILRFYGGSSADRCRADCVANGSCKGYTFLRAGGYSPSDPAMCYLLTKVSDRTQHSCCVSGERSGRSEPSGNALSVNWTTGAPYKGQNIRVTYNCPPGGNPSMGNVWGTDYYTYDSSVCIAAVHMGLITFANGGRVTFEMRQGAASYRGSTRNGVTSGNWGTYDGSYVFVP